MLIELDIPLDQVTSPIVRRFYNIWNSKRGTRVMPSWQDIDPSEMLAILPNMFVISIEMDPFRIFYRLIGTKAVAFRHELTGRYLDEITEYSDDVRAELIKEYSMVCAEKRPTFSKDTLKTKFGNTLIVSGSIFPLSTDGTIVDRCIAVEDYEGTSRPDDIAQSDAGHGYGPWKPGDPK
jgi:hypothetical protein